MRYDVMPLGMLPLGTPTNRPVKVAAEKPAIKIADGVYERDGKMFTDLPMSQPEPIQPADPASDYRVDVAYAGWVACAEAMMAKACGLPPVMCGDWDVNPPLVIGVDPAKPGGDETAMIYRRNVEQDYGRPWGSPPDRRRGLDAKLHEMDVLNARMAYNVRTVLRIRRSAYELEDGDLDMAETMVDGVLTTLAHAHRVAVPPLMQRWIR